MKRVFKATLWLGAIGLFVKGFIMFIRSDLEQRDKDYFSYRLNQMWSEYATLIAYTVNRRRSFNEEFWVQAVHKQIRELKGELEIFVDDFKNVDRIFIRDSVYLANSALRELEKLTENAANKNRIGMDFSVEKVGFILRQLNKVGEDVWLGIYKWDRNQSILEAS